MMLDTRLQFAFAVSLVLIWQITAEDVTDGILCIEPFKIQCRCGLIGKLENVYVESCRVLNNNSTNLCEPCPGACEAFSRCKTCSIDGCLTCPQGKMGIFCEVDSTSLDIEMNDTKSFSLDKESDKQLQEKLSEISTEIPSVSTSEESNLEITFHLTRSKLQNFDETPKKPKSESKYVGKTGSKKHSVQSSKETSAVSPSEVDEKHKVASVVSTSDLSYRKTEEIVPADQKSSDVPISKGFEESDTHLHVEPALSTRKQQAKAVKEVHSTETVRPPLEALQKTEVKDPKIVETVTSGNKSRSEVTQNGSIDNSMKYFVTNLRDLIEMLMSASKRDAIESKHAKNIFFGPLSNDHERFLVFSPKMSLPKRPLMEYPYELNFRSINTFPIPIKSGHKSGKSPHHVHGDDSSTTSHPTHKKKSEHGIKSGIIPHFNPLYALFNYHSLHNEPLPLYKQPSNYYVSYPYVDDSYPFYREFHLANHRDYETNAHYLPTIDRALYQQVGENPFLRSNVESVGPIFMLKPLPKLVHHKTEKDEEKVPSIPKSVHQKSEKDTQKVHSSKKAHLKSEKDSQKVQSSKKFVHQKNIKESQKDQSSPKLSNKTDATNKSKILLQQQPNDASSAFPEQQTTSDLNRESTQPPVTVPQETMTTVKKESIALLASKPDKIKFTLVEDDGKTVTSKQHLEFVADGAHSFSHKVNPSDDSTSTLTPSEDKILDTQRKHDETQWNVDTYDEEDLIASRLDPQEHLFRAKRRATNSWCKIQKMTRHGDLDCTIWSYQKICRLTCHDGYSAPSSVYKCTPTKKWDPPMMACYEGSDQKSKKLKASYPKRGPEEAYDDTFA